MDFRFDELVQMASSFLKLCPLQNQKDAFLLGSISSIFLQNTESDDFMEHLAITYKNIKQLIEGQQLEEIATEDLLKLIFQHLKFKFKPLKNFQEVPNKVQKEDSNTPAISSREASPELKPSSIIIRQSQKNTLYWNGSNNEMKQNANYQRQPSTDQATLNLIKQLQQEDEQQIKKQSAVKGLEKMDCQICSDQLEGTDIYPLEGCIHIYHIDCLKEYILQALKERRVDIRCPDVQCTNLLNELDIGTIAGKEKQEDYHKYTLDQFVDTHAQDMSWCPTPDCRYAFVFDESDFSCPLCKKRYCLECRVPFHKNQSCKEFQVTNTRDENDVKFEKFVKGRKFKMCTKCKFWVEKNQGCDHMTCRCGYQFCYKCGGRYMQCECVEAQKKKMEEHRKRLAERKKQRGKRR